MFLLPPAIRRLLKKRKGKAKRVLSLDIDIVPQLQRISEKQRRSEEEILAEWVSSGIERASEDATAEAGWKALSRREQEILAQVCFGKKNFEIADSLGINEQTVKTHLQNIFRKFNLRSKKELRQLLHGWNFTEWWVSH